MSASTGMRQVQDFLTLPVIDKKNIFERIQASIANQTRTTNALERVVRGIADDWTDVKLLMEKLVAKSLYNGD